MPSGGSESSGVSSSSRRSKKPTRARAERPRARPASRPAAKAAKQPRPRKPAAKPEPRSSQLPTPKPLPAKPAVPAPRPGIRLSGSASSRLTIKPSPPTGPRPQLQLSTKVRPSGPRRLTEVELDEDEVLIDGLDAVL